MVRKAKNRYEDFISYLKTSVKDFNPKSTFDFLLALLGSQIDADCCLLIDKYEQILFKSPTISNTLFSHTILKKAMHQKESIFIQNAINDEKWKYAQSIAENIFLSVICIILKDETEKVIGALYLDRHFPEKDPFTKIDLEKAEEFISNFTSILISEGTERKEISRLKEDYGFEGLIGKCELMLHLYKQINKVAPTNSNVLLQGETGTGKELVARAIHKRSKRVDCPFIAINCSAIPKDLIESELFGHERGSFTGAVSKRIGKFEMAHTGTLFLDEIGDMNVNLQTKLLRVLQEGEIQPVGSEKVIKIDIRLITASSKDIIKEIQAGNFRKELFYRINSYPLQLSPLRDRGNDIILLAEYFLTKFCEKNYNYIPVPYFTAKAKRKLLDYSWEGNVRELLNLMENLSISCEEGVLIDEEQLKFYPIEKEVDPAMRSSISLKNAGEQAELELVKASLQKHKWNKAKVIKELNTSYPTLSKIMKKFGLDKN